MGAGPRDPGEAVPTGTVTFLFTDVEGSTHLLRALGPAYPGVLARHRELIRSAVADDGGREFGSEGDALFVVFPTAPPAVAAAVRAQAALAAEPWPGGARVAVRMGIHTGEGSLSGGDYVGLDVHRAARVAAAAHGGQVLLSDATRALTENSLPEGAGLRDLGEHRLKDLEHPERLFQVLVPGLRRDFPPPRSLSARPNNLPVQLTSFVGRRDEVAAVRELLRSNRLVTLTGPGGTGKTRLALAVGAEALEDFEDGVFLVALAPIADPELVPTTIAQSLGLQASGDRPVIQTVEDALRDRRTLLLLDNFEQVIDAAPVVADLLGAAPGVRVAVTSREALRVSGEQEFPVPPLRVPDPAHLPPLDALSQYEAVALFIQRARSMDPTFAVTNENAPAVAEICARLDGLPLAIELAAARIKLLTPEALLPRLERSLTVLRGGPRDLPARQRTLRDAIAWSYDLLEDGDRAVFRRLGAFVGRWTLSAAGSLVDPGGELGVDMVESLASLVDKSLIRRGMPLDGEPGFWMLETIREYAVERLEEAGEAEAVRARHAALYLRLAEEAEPHLTAGPRWLDRLQEEHDNIRAAIGWSIRTGDAETGFRIGSAVWRFWHLRGHLSEGRMWLTELLALPAASARTPARGRALTALASIVYWQGDYRGAEPLYREALESLAELGEERGAAYAMFSLAYVEAALGNAETAARWAERSLEIYERLGDRVMAVEARIMTEAPMWLGVEYTEESLARTEEILEASREVGNPFLVANSLTMTGRVRLALNDLPGARADLVAALQTFRDLGDASGMAFTLDYLAHLWLTLGEPERAVALGGAAQMLRDDLGGAAPTALVHIDDIRETSRGRLDEAAVREAWEEGRGLTVEEAVEVAVATAPWPPSSSAAGEPEAATPARTPSPAPEG